MIRRLIDRAPLTFGWAASAACAFLGAYFSSDARMTAGIWAAGGFLVLIWSCLTLYRVKYRASRYRELVGFYEWSTRTLFVVRDKDGRYWQWSVAQLRYAGDLLYDTPRAASVYNHEWLVTKEGAATDGEPA